MKCRFGGATLSIVLLATLAGPLDAAEHSLRHLPLHFEANDGQIDSRVAFVARGGSETIFLSPAETAIVLTGSMRDAGRTPRTVLRMKFAGASRRARMTGVDTLPGVANYFIGNDPSQWRANVSTYGKVQSTQIYAGIDAVFYGNGSELEFDFVVAPGGDPSRIRIGIDGARAIFIDGHGNAVLRLQERDILLRRPAVYQTLQGTRHEIAGDYVLKGHELRFRVGAYDARERLVIDPVLAYATYLGGTYQDGVNAIAVDGAGNMYVTGATDSPDFPLSPSPYQSTFTGATYTFPTAFVTKIDPTQSGAASLVYSTYLGGAGGSAAGLAIAVNGMGEAYVAGITGSAMFPVTATAFSSTGLGFVTKFNAAGTALLYSTRTRGNDYVLGVALDGSGNAYVTGYTDTSLPFAVTAGAAQSTFGGVQDAFVIKIDPSQSGGASLVYGTYIGGSNGDAGRAIAVDSAGNAYVAGYTGSTDFPVTIGAYQTTSASPGNYEAFVTKVNAAGTSFTYSTLLGGGYDDYAFGVAVNAAGEAYVGGYTASIDFPVTSSAFQSAKAGSYDAFVTKLNVVGDTLLYSTYFGGGNNEYAAGALAIDGAGNAYVAGYTDSTTLPVTADAFQPALNGTGAASTNSDLFVAKFDVHQSGAASLLYATYLGGSGHEANNFSNINAAIAVDASSNVYVAGASASTDFPVTPSAFQSTNNSGGWVDGVVAKFAACPPPSGAWSATGSMTAGRMAHAATRLANGKVLIAGGLDVATSLDNPLASALIFDPTTGLFSSTGSMATPRKGHTATLLSNGKVLVAGGTTTGSGGVCTNTAELFDPAANNGAGAFTSAGTMNEYRDEFTATLLPNGKVLLAGGACTGGSSAELYDPAANSGSGAFVTTASMSKIRIGHTATLLANGKVLVAAGMDTINQIVLDSAEIFDPAANGGAGGFSIVAGTLATARHDHRATLLPSGRVLMIGGLDANIVPLSSAEIFDPATGAFSATGSMAFARSAHTATRLGNGQVLVAGGLANGTGFLDSAEVFDESAGAAGAFSTIAHMGTPREQHSATLLADGRVLVVGGSDSGSTILASAELYSPPNCAPFNTPTGSNVTIAPIDTTTGQAPVSVSFTTVTRAGQTTLTTNNSGPTPPPNFQLGNGIYYHVETTATFTGDVTVCIDYSGTALAGTQPVFKHYNSATGLWETPANITYTPPPPNDTRVCGAVSSLSPFGLFIPVDVTPPTVSCSVTPNVLWPPNHQLIPVTVTVTVVDAGSGPAGFALSGVTSSEPDAGLGDGDRPNDIQGFIVGTASTHGFLRAERSGPGRGRTYTLTFAGRDLSGNSANCTATVSVPHDQRR